MAVAKIAGNFDRATNPHPHPNPTDFAHEVCIRRMRIADIGWLHHIPNGSMGYLALGFNTASFHLPMTITVFLTCRQHDEPCCHGEPRALLWHHIMMMSVYCVLDEGINAR